MKVEEKQQSTKEEKFKYWKMSAKELLTHFDQTVMGYSDTQMQEVVNKYSPNELEEEEKESILEKILEQFKDPLVKILLGAAIISFVIAFTGDQSEGLTAFVEPFVILLILIANATIGVWQDLNADKAIEALKALQASKCHVKRNGKTIAIDSKDVYPGDIVYLSAGEKCPADLRVIDILTSNFDVSQANFTGETEPSYKVVEPILSDEKPSLTDLKNVIFSSSGVTTGSALGIVVKTGMETELGNIQIMVREAKKTKEDEDEKSPLAKKLDEFGDQLTYVIGAICVVVWVINYKNFFDEVHGTFFNGMIYYFKISVALAVAAIPEGLPAVITTCFALGSKRMSANNAIVRKLDAIETLGCTSVICSDKTGTLTTNNMSVVKFMTVDDETSVKGTFKEVVGSSFKPEGEVKEFDSRAFENSKNLQTAAICAAVCNISEIKIDNHGHYVIQGSPTEGAIRVFAEKLRIYDNRFKPNTTEDPMAYIEFLSNDYKVLHILEFDRNRKAMSVVALDKKKNKPILLTKGAPEILVNQCSRYMTKEGKYVNLTDTTRNDIINQVRTDFMSKSLRSLVLCINEDLKSLQEIDFNDRNTLKAFFKNQEKVREAENNLTFLGIVGMLDPPRQGVDKAIETCNEAGIRVIMITGDNKDTAEAIGKSIGIVHDEASLKNSSFTTAEFFSLPEKDQLEILKKSENMIFSRSEPEKKMKLIKLLKKLDHIVAMTGDGVNDAAALAESHIGISMGLSGTDVAKEASHIVLADDNFVTIVKAIEEGRSIYMNMKAFIRYLISSNIGEVVAIFITSAFGIPEAFTSIQLLWVK
jgi:P-type Ca2+ transporter type 2C